MKLTIFLLLTISILLGCNQKKDSPHVNQETPANIPNKNITPVINFKDLQKYFDEYKVKGTIVLYDLKNSVFTYHDSARAYKEFIPASTFKIPNSLFSLEVGAVKDENELIKWDGKKRNRE